MNNSIYEHIRKTLLNTNGTGKLLSPITEDMFVEADIVRVFFSEEGDFIVKFRGLTGILPGSFFDEKAKQKIFNIVKSRDSVLWKTLNE